MLFRDDCRVRACRRGLGDCGVMVIVEVLTPEGGVGFTEGGCKARTRRTGIGYRKARHAATKICESGPLGERKERALRTKNYRTTTSSMSENDDCDVDSCSIRD